MSGSANISPTAHWTGGVWRRDDSDSVTALVRDLELGGGPAIITEGLVGTSPAPPMGRCASLSRGSVAHILEASTS